MRTILQYWGYWLALIRFVRGIGLKNLTNSNLINLPNSITAIGIVLTIWLISLIWSQSTNNHLLIFLLAVGVGFSDFFDGWTARRWQIITSVGGFLDKFRDKFFACSIFIYFLTELWYQADGIWFVFIKGLLIWILIIESFLITLWIYGFIKGFDTAAHLGGKIKTDFYFIAIGWWFFLQWLGNLFQRRFEEQLYLGLVFLLSVASVFGIISIAGYLQRYRSIKNSH